MEKNVIRHFIDYEGESSHKLFEPLPFYEYGPYEESFDVNVMKIHINSNAQKKQIFIPKKPVKVYVTAEKQSLTHMIHPFIYTITLTHYTYTWSVSRTYREIKETHKALAKLAKANLGIACHDIPKDKIKPEWPLFPTSHETLIPDHLINKHCKHIAQYFESLLTFPPYRDHPAVHAFLSVSPLSFIPNLSPSLIEDMLHKKSGDIQLYGNCIKSRILCQKLKVWYEKRWFCLKDTYIVYLNPFFNYSISFVLLVDREFECKMTIKANAYHAIEIKNLERRLILKCKNSHQQKEWYDKIMLMLSNTGKFFNDLSLLRYESYAPNRTNQLCRWYVNASTYMEHVMHALNNAKEEIYIADWWLCPELFLKRPTDDQQYRLDKILLNKAKEGVKIYILLYKEITLVINLMSLRTRQILTEYGANPNIKVLRHPDHFFDGVFMWSHHEKFVIIDQSIAFLGGIDLCYGRWDDDNHRLIDLGKKENVTQVEDKRELSSNTIIVHSQSEINIDSDKKAGFKYINQYQDSQQLLSSLVKQNQVKNGKKMNDSDLKLIKAFTSNNIRESPFNGEISNPPQNNKKFSSKQAKNIVIRNIRQTKQMVMPRKPIVLKNSSGLYNVKRASGSFDKTDQDKGTAKSGSPKPVDQALAQNYKKQVKWVTTKKDMVKSRKMSNIFSVSGLLKQRTNINDDIYDRWHMNSKANQSFIDIEDIELPKNTDAGYYYWIGKDYANTYKEDFKEVHEYNKEQFDRTETPRMPWRDQGIVIIGHSARDLARHFIQRWNQCKNEQIPLLETYPYLIPKSYIEKFNYDFRDFYKDDLYKCSIQMLRSVDDWSAGISKTETSILNAYIDLIKKAQHYIYIENQFFITTCNPSKDIVKNNIGQALVERIKLAHKNNEKFRVFIFLPLLPGFDRMNAIKAVQYYNLRSIRFGEYSIYKELLKEGIKDPSEYITFHGMRNWSVLMGKLVQEIIYVHSKLMIVDDKYVLCGSANINDRSLVGKRDSEVAALVTDEEFLDSTLNKKPYKAGKYALSLREKIFKLHLGVYFLNPSQIDVTDCVSDEFFTMFKKISHQNTLVYDEVFKCLPSDNILNFNDLKNLSKQTSLSKTNPSEGQIKMEKFVCGLVVDFPLHFLSHEENFFPDLDTAEGIVPSEIWI